MITVRLSLSTNYNKHVNFATKLGPVASVGASLLSSQIAIAVKGIRSLVSIGPCLKCIFTYWPRIGGVAKRAQNHWFSSGIARTSA